MEDHGDAASLTQLTALLRALEMLAFIARHLHPPDFGDLMGSIGAPDEELRSAKQAQGPGRLSGIKAVLDRATETALESFSGLREALREERDIRRVYRALRLLPKALEEIYPLAGVLPPVNRFFLEPALRSEEALQQPFLGAPGRDNTGVMQFGEWERGGFWLYVPENYSSERAWPLVMALMAAAGRGACFSGVGCAMLAAVARSWWLRHRSGAPGH
jgi:phospholipase/carboxylesterase